MLEHYFRHILKERGFEAVDRVYQIHSILDILPSLKTRPEGRGFTLLIFRKGLISNNSLMQRKQDYQGLCPWSLFSLFHR